MAIDAYTRSAEDLFNTAISLEIPPFQRAYVWEHDKHWAPLWDDVADLADAVLDATNDGTEPLAEDQGPTHFLGAVVLHRQSGQLGRIPVYRVIDGQQRLTTWQLLLHAAKEAYGERGLDEADDLEDLVHNDPKKTKGQAQQELKIVPTRANRAEFLHAMHGKPLPDNHVGTLIVPAHNYFHGQVAEWLDSDQDNVTPRADALYKALALLLQIVVIELDHNADPQIIFETLNARGEPLLQSDLVKNYIIHIAEQEGHSAEIVAHDDEWLARYDDGWWKVEVAQGRLRRQRVEQFLNYWLVMREAAEVAAGDVFRTFQKHVADNNLSIRDTVHAMNVSSKHYAHVIDTPSTSAIAEQLRHLKILEAGVVTPAILWLMANVPQDRTDVTERAMRALESYYVRRVLCGRTSMGLNRVIHEVLDRLNAADPLSADRVVIEHLREQTVDRRSWPSDSLVSTTLLERGIYSMARRKLAMVLEAIARHLAPPKAEPVDYSSLTIEHVMPQKWRGELWAPPVDGFARAGETPESARDRLIHTIGNLTLLTQPLNSAISNDPWSEKRPQIRDYSLTAINRDLLEHAGDVWDEATILARSERLAEIAIKIWPGPDDI